MVNVEQLNELMHNRQVLFLSDTLCTGYFAADMAEVRLGDDVAVFGAGPVGCSLV
jgi:S-(hydroxymethyl)glutathione dehydrogenase/alcohol dehydrogenase